MKDFSKDKGNKFFMSVMSWKKRMDLNSIKEYSN